MIRVIKMSNKWYGLKIDITDEEEIQNIKQFVEEGTPVIIAEDLDALESLYDLDKDGSSISILISFGESTRLIRVSRLFLPQTGELEI